MIKSIFTKSLFFCVLTLQFSCKKISKEKQPIALNNEAQFEWFEYTGNDSIYNALEKKENEYYNPILAGFNPDPSICEADGSYYLITSSFTYFPGMPIYKSSDLVNWKLIGHVITRKDQANFSGQRVSRGMFAPTIRYHEGTFYVICTNVDDGGNFIVTSKNPEQGWSDPIWLPEINGIDPDLFFDDDGKVYITHNGPPPNNKSLYDGHRAIYIWEYDLETKKIVSDSTLLVNGGTDISKEPVWIEAPHIFKRNNYYYLFCAEGGTAYNHSEVVFRSKHILGPYESFNSNPILTQRHLPRDRPNQITTAGHADLVVLPNGEWWAVYLGCRPYDEEYYNTGRETFLLPLQWKNDWPIFENGLNPHPFVNKKPDLPNTIAELTPVNGNFTWKDEFDENYLDLNWNFVKTLDTVWYKIKDGKLIISPLSENIHGLSNFSSLVRRQQHKTFEAITKFSFSPDSTSQTAGLFAFQNEKYYLLLGTRLNKNSEVEIFVEKNAGSEPEILASNIVGGIPEYFIFKIEGKTRYYDFYYKTKAEDNWKLLAEGVDASNLSTKIAKGFVGTMIGIYASNQHFIDFKE